VRKEFSPFRFAACALCLLSLFASRANAQDKDQKQDHPNGIVQDWSRHHLAYPRFGPIQSIIAVQHDPRAILSWQEAEREDWHRAKDRDEDRDGDGDHRHSHGTPSGVHRDWSIPLGLETTAPAMYPAKYTFYLTAAPSCSTDFIVYPVNVAGSTTQPNIVAFNNLYSGTVPTTGLCNRGSPVNDDGVSATTMWSYFVQAAGGVVATSPTLSLDGTRVAFVESVSGISAQFHVLAWKSGDGVTTTAQSLSVPGAQNVLIPATINTFVGLAPVAGSGTATNLTLGSTGDTLSSPFVDYNNDVAYVGNDSGTLFRVKDVFCTTPACISGGTPAPSLDASWGLGGVLATTCPGKLTGPVVAGTGNIFVGCSNGTLYGFTPAGVAISGSPLTVGSGGSTGGIVDPPLVDVVNGFLYVVAGNSSGTGTPSILVQASTASFTTPAPVIATLGAGGHFNLHAPTFNEAYFTSPFSSVANVQGTVNGGTTGSTGNTSNWQIYEWADSGVVGSPATLYGVGFNSSSHDMTAGPASNFIRITSSLDAEFSPLTQLLNGGTDQLFVSALLAATTPPNTIVYNLTDFPGLFPNVFPNPPGAAGATATEGSGTTGIVVDNVSGQAQASSIYFGALVANTAVKLTQSGLN
jgi:hypothetical protein